MIDNNDSELILLTPSMGSNTVAGITISCSNLKRNSLRDVTSPSANACIEVDKGSFDNAWIQFEFAQSKVVNFLDMATHQDETQRTARWFRLVASNDGESQISEAENWDLLLEREYQEDWKQCETRYFEFENTTAYKFYRLVCLYVGDSSPLWRISRFRLFRRESGVGSFVNSLPQLISPTQDGYEISANSEADSGHVAINAFDGNADTKWATQSGDHVGAWLKIKLPEATAFNAAYLQARNDQYYHQAPTVFKIQASEDGETWIDLTYESASWSQKEGKAFYWFNETPYLYYRLLVESVQSGSNAGLARFELGRRAKTYRRHLTRYDSAVPILTSNNENGYIVTCSSYYDQHAAYKVFNGSTDANSKWLSQGGQASEAWIKVELPSPIAASLFDVASPNESYTERMPNSFKIQGSNDNVTWDDLLVVPSVSWSRNERKSWDTENVVAYAFYRLLIVTVSGSAAAIGDWKILSKSLITEY
jgi:hypothetical protein